MKATMQSKPLTAISALVIILIGGGLIYYRPSVSFNLDDALIFFNIIESKSIYWGIDHFDKGRFYPLAFMDLNLLMRLFPTSDILTAPRIYFFANAVAFALLTCALLYLLMQIVPLSYSVLALLICFVNLGFVIVFMGVCFPERVQVVWLSGYILGLFFLAHKQKQAGLWALGCVSYVVGLVCSTKSRILSLSVGVWWCLLDLDSTMDIRVAHTISTLLYLSSL